MKKIIFLFLFLSVFLVACSNKKADDKTIVVDNTKLEYEVVELTLDNYYKYITIYEDVKESTASKPERLYFNFYGADGCRFDDCVITYVLGEKAFKLKLSIDGDGQVIIRGNYAGALDILKISGTVKCPKI